MVLVGVLWDKVEEISTPGSRRSTGPPKEGLLAGPGVQGFHDGHCHRQVPAQQAEAQATAGQQGQEVAHAAVQRLG